METIIFCLKNKRYSLKGKNPKRNLENTKKHTFESPGEIYSNRSKGLGA
jgi:hypothetical protein